MKKLLLISASMLVITGSAMAAQSNLVKQPATTLPQPSTWTGIYAGMNAGGTFGQTSFSATPGSNWWGDPDSPGVFSATNRNTPMGGATFGGQVGYNYQFSNNIVAGFEADGNWFGATGNYSSGAFPGVYNGFYSADGNFSGNWLLTARGRVGYSITPDILIYGTGGLAVADYSYSHRAYYYNDPLKDPNYSVLTSSSRIGAGEYIPKSNFVSPVPEVPPGTPIPSPDGPNPKPPLPPGPNDSPYYTPNPINPTPGNQVICLNPGNQPHGNCRGDNGGRGLYRLPFTTAMGAYNAVRQTLSKAGWTVGGGVEWKMAENWSVKAEYLYVKLGSQTSNSYYVSPYDNLPVFGMQHRFAINSMNIVRAGINYHLNWDGLPTMGKL